MPLVSGLLFRCLTHLGDSPFFWSKIMNLVNHQVEVEGYISDTGNLCLAFNKDDLVDIDSKDVLIINHSCAENFVLGLYKLLKELQNG
jgi:hypothetical protein